jgi:hypothetical protein
MLDLAELTVMILKKWDDSTLDCDSRREDPLYYYRPSHGWEGAIGIQIDPLYEEDKASEITIKVFDEHSGRVDGHPEEFVLQMYTRLLSILTARFPQWTQITLSSPVAKTLKENKEINKILMVNGFNFLNFDNDQCATWKKS